MKKLVFPSIAFAFCIVLSGCIDIYQYLTKDANGIERNTIKVTVSKTVFAMANGFSDSSNAIDYEELFDESSPIDIGEYNQFNASIKKVNDTMDVGYLVAMNIDYRDRNIVNKINSNNTSFIPKYNGKDIIIHIDCIGENSDSADNEMAMAFLATGKYRLAISKKCIANIDRITIKTDENETNINFTDLYDEYLVEIPIPIIFMSDIDLILYSK